MYTYRRTATEQRKNREPTAGEVKAKEKQVTEKAALFAAKVRKETEYTFARMTELQEEYPTALVMGTDGGAFPDGTAAGYGSARRNSLLKTIDLNCGQIASRSI